MKLPEKIMLYMFSGTIAFIILALAYDVITGTSTKTFESTLQNSEIVNVIIITSVSYNEKDWEKIKKITIEETTKTSDVKKLNQDVLLILTRRGYAVIVLNITHQIVNVSVSDVL